MLLTVLKYPPPSVANVSVFLGELNIGELNILTTLSLECHTDFYMQFYVNFKVQVFYDYFSIFKIVYFDILRCLI